MEEEEFSIPDTYEPVLFEDRELPDEPEPLPSGPLERWSLAGSLAGLALLVLLQGLLLGSWIKRDSRPPAWDQSVQLETAVDLQRAMEGGDWRRLLTLGPKPGMPPFPPLYHLSMQFAFDEEDPAKSALWVNLFYLALLCVSLWGIGRHFSGNWAGLGAAVLFSCTPHVQELLRENLVDLALASWVAAAYWMLVISQSFERKRWSVLFGVFFAAGMLTKWSAFSYFLPVLWVFVQASRKPGRRAGAALAVAAAAVLTAPWYLSQWPVLVPRLFSAAGDQAIPLWKGGAVFAYVFAMAEGLEFPFFVLGLVSLTVPSVRRRGGDTWVLLAWFAASLVFWTIVPNRQLRYLLPGLAPLAVFAMGPWPRGALIGLCALQGLSALNYGFGWVPPLRFGLGVPVAFFTSRAPERADWKIGEILKEAERRHELGLPFGNLTLLANHPRLNGPTLNWERKRHGVEKIRIRGVNKRVCEFSEFVLVKLGSLGPASVVNQLPKVREEILEEGSWFRRGYKEARRWPLPDETEAVLFQRRRMDEPPLRERVARFDHYEEKAFLIEGMVVDFGKWDGKRGVYRRAALRAKRIVIRGLEVKDAKLEMEGLSLVPVNREKQGVGSTRGLLLNCRLLRMKRLRLLSGSVSAKSVENFIKARVPDVRSARVTLDETVSVEAVVRGLSVAAEASIELRPDGSGLDVAVEKASVAGVGLPAGLLGRHARYALEFAPDPELPFHLEVKRLSIAGGALRIGRAAGGGAS